MLDCPIVVKEVGQGMGPGESQTIIELPLAAIDFGAAGGTNFALLEILRSSEKCQVTIQVWPISDTLHCK